MLGVAIVERDQAAVIHRHDAAAQVDVDALGPVVAEQMLGDQRRQFVVHRRITCRKYMGDDFNVRQSRTARARRRSPFRNCSTR